MATRPGFYERNGKVCRRNADFVWNFGFAVCIECFQQPGGALIPGEVLTKQEELYTKLGVKP